MKKITKSTIALFALATLFISCSKDDSKTETVSKDPIVGNWITDNAVLSVPDSDPETLDVDGDCQDKAYLNIKSDKTFEEQDLNTQNCAPVIIRGKWEKAENSMTITLPGGATGTFDITSNTDHKLKLKLNNLPGYPEGTSIEFSYTKK